MGWVGSLHLTAAPWWQGLSWNIWRWQSFSPMILQLLISNGLDTVILITWVSFSSQWFACATANFSWLANVPLASVIFSDRVFYFEKMSMFIFVEDCCRELWPKPKRRFVFSNLSQSWRQVTSRGFPKDTRPTATLLHLFSLGKLSHKLWFSTLDVWL